MTDRPRPRTLPTWTGEPWRFVRAVFIDPVPRDHQEPAAALHRRRVVSAVTLVVGAALLAYSLRLEPGDPTFYATTAVLAVVWSVGAVASGPLHLGWARTRSGERFARPVVQPVIVGTALLVVFCIGALVVGQIPVVRGSIRDVLDHASYGSPPLVALITFVNGVTEEVFFRGALFAAISSRHRVLIATGLYTLTVVATGSVTLVLAAFLLGVVVGLQRVVSGGLLAPMITHVVWSLGMFLLLPVLVPA